MLSGVVCSYLVYLRGQALVAKMGSKTPAVWVHTLPVAYALFSALIGTQSILFSKTLSTLLRTSTAGECSLMGF